MNATTEITRSKIKFFYSIIFLFVSFNNHKVRSTFLYQKVTYFRLGMKKLAKLANLPSLILRVIQIVFFELKASTLS